jgi:AcrR family transcriptional regulator
MSTEMLDTQPPGRRERKKLATRQALQDAALRLVADRGLEQVTVEDISEAADVATRTFFNYFSSKEEALLGDAPEKVATVHRLVADRPATESPLEAVHQVLRELALQQAQRREELLLRQRVIERHPGLLARQLGMYASFERALAAAVAERPGVPADVRLGDVDRGRGRGQGRGVVVDGRGGPPAAPGHDRRRLPAPL